MESDIVRCQHCGQRNRVPPVAAGTPRCANCHQWLPWIATAGDEDFADVVEKAFLPALVDLWATWCGPCRTVGPALEQLAGERAGQLKLVKIDIDRAPVIAQRFTVQAVPTLLLLEHGRVLARRSGAAPVAALRHWLNQTLPETTTQEAPS